MKVTGSVWYKKALGFIAYKQVKKINNFRCLRLRSRYLHLKHYKEQGSTFDDYRLERHILEVIFMY